MRPRHQGDPYEERFNAKVVPNLQISSGNEKQPNQ